MYIIAIAWLWVALLMAITETSIVAGLITLFMWGLLPCSLMLWFSASRVRRERQAYRELLAGQRADDDNRGNTKPDQ